VRVNGVSPGLIDTEIHASGGDAGRAARLAPQVPMGRVGGADEVADTIVWLLSDGARYVTGQVLRVSGGR
jgi:NAD(P)-dependent dehydrogenase (short-subunit alcohol dehydrogenase family)